MSQRHECTKQCKDANWESPEAYQKYREEKASGETEKQREAREQKAAEKSKDALLSLYNSVKKDKTSGDTQPVSSLPPLFLAR